MAFKDLREFAADNTKAISMRLGELSTEDIYKEAMNIVSSRGEDVSQVSNKGRQELIQLITEKIGFKGFLEELSMLIKKAAIEGLVAQAEQWGPEGRAKPPGGLPPIKGNDIRAWAEQVVADQLSKGGINIRSTISEAQNPLYGSRTFFASGCSSVCANPCNENRAYRSMKAKKILELIARRYKYGRRT